MAWSSILQADDRNKRGLSSIEEEEIKLNIAWDKYKQNG